MVCAARGLRVPPVAELEAAALFLGVVAGARALTFPLPGGSEVSLDTAIFVAAAACLGPALTSIGVAWVLAVDGMRRARLPYALYLGGVAGALLIGLVARVRRRRRRQRPRRVAGAGARRRLPRHALRDAGAAGVARRAAVRSRRSSATLQSVVAEATLLPLASAIVLIWEPRRPVPFALLGGTYLLVNYGFKRLAELASDLRRRVAELETLNRTAHALGASLETPALLAALLARDGARAAAGRAHRRHRRASDGELVRYRFERGELSLPPADERDKAALARRAAPRSTSRRARAARPRCARA